MLFSTLFIKLFTQIVFCDKLLPLLLLTVAIVGVGATVAMLTTLAGSSAERRGIEIVYGWAELGSADASIVIMNGGGSVGLGGTSTDDAEGVGWGGFGCSASSDGIEIVYGKSTLDPPAALAGIVIIISVLAVLVGGG